MDVERWSAFTDTPDGGNPAGVAITDRGDEPDDTTMQRIAADVGYSETAFLVPTGPTSYRVRYFAPEAEVDFCGHATIAAGAALVVRDPSVTDVVLETARVGHVPVRLSIGADGLPGAQLTSPPTAGRPLDDEDLDALLDLLGWDRSVLDRAIPVEVASAGNDHPVLPLASRETLAGLTYSFEPMRDLMRARGWVTLQVVHRLDERTYASRNPFASGGVVEDPATGAAAAAFGGTLRRHGLLPPSGLVVIHQGQDMGRPSTLQVDATGADGDPVRVSGTAVPITEHAVRP